MFIVAAPLSYQRSWRAKAKIPVLFRRCILFSDGFVPLNLYVLIARTRREIWPMLSAPTGRYSDQDGHLHRQQRPCRVLPERRPTSRRAVARSAARGHSHRGHVGRPRRRGTLCTCKTETFHRARHLTAQGSGRMRGYGPDGREERARYRDRFSSLVSCRYLTWN